MLDGYSRRDFLLGVLATGALSATATYYIPGGRGLPRTREIQLRLDTGSDETGAHKLLKDIWERGHPDIKIELVDLSRSTNDQKATMTGDAESGKADILNLDVINIQEFANKGLISEIDLEDVDGFLPITRRPAIKRRTGKTFNESDSNPYWAAPFNADAGMVFERVSTDRPLPDSQNTLSSIIDKRVPKRSQGFAAQLPTQPGSASREAFVVNVLEHALSRTEDILDADGMPNWDLTAWQAALEPLRTAIVEGKIFPVRRREGHARCVPEEHTAVHEELAGRISTLDTGRGSRCDSQPTPDQSSSCGHPWWPEPCRRQEFAQCLKGIRSRSLFYQPAGTKNPRRPRLRSHSHHRLQRS
jgi:multiple sugar transport system substrate-binding protein